MNKVVASRMNIFLTIYLFVIFIIAGITSAFVWPGETFITESFILWGFFGMPGPFLVLIPLGLLLLLLSVFIGNTGICINLYILRLGYRV